MKRISTLLLFVLIFSFCHLSMAYGEFGAVAPEANNPADRNIAGAVVQWGSRMLNRLVSRNDGGRDGPEDIAITGACKTIVDFLGCDYEVYLYDDNADQIIERFVALTKQGKTAGFCPLIVIPSDILAEILSWTFLSEGAENAAEGIAAYRQKIIDAANEIDAEAFLSARLDQYMEEYKEFDLLGEFERFTPNHSLVSFMLLYNSRQEVIIAKIPTENPWELAAWIPMGGYNACPMPEEQAAVFKYWHEKYGAVPAAITYDVWEMMLTRPPVTDEEAETLAKEQFAFCEDSVFQGAQTIRRLASFLKNSTTWFFWWD